MLEFAFLPARGLGNAAATLVGQNLGANQPERAEQSAWNAAKYNVIFMFVIGLLLLALAPEIADWFTDDPQVLRYAQSCLRIMGFGYPMYALGMIMVQSLNGAGEAVSPSVMNLICFWILQVPLAFWLAVRAGLGPNGVFVAIVIAESLLTILAVYVFRTGGWKQQTV